MSAKQPEALQLAELLEQGRHLILVERKNAGAELRRLHVENESLKSELRVEQAISFRRQMQEYAAQRDELLEFAKEWLDRQGSDENYMTAKARAAIAKAIG